LAKRQFVLYYQPQIAATGQLIGVEALLRWQRPGHGLVTPGQFIAIAEESDLILPLGAWVLETACAQLVAWSSVPDLAHLTIAVNVSISQFQRADFVQQVLLTLAQSGADPQRLKLELTESLLITDTDAVVGKMRILREAGIRFALDDFGTGYSSLAYLQRLPLDQLKIDQAFIRNLLSDRGSEQIVQTIIALGRSLGLAVIAEGVETEAQRQLLQQLGCEAYQGYLYGQPLLAAQVVAWATGQIL
jgi:EAL domain-containing protein (putative c-di-GMP-specific phosphodiesterase class I)